MDFFQFLDGTQPMADALIGSYRWDLVVFSLFIAVVAGYACLTLSGRIKASNQKRTAGLWPWGRVDVLLHRYTHHRVDQGFQAALDEARRDGTASAVVPELLRLSLESNPAEAKVLRSI